jgi:Cu2+-exporting ATPase
MDLVPLEKIKKPLLLKLKKKIMLHATHNHDHGTFSCTAEPGKYACALREEIKSYTMRRRLSVCGMDLVQQPVLNQRQQYTCPMHPKLLKTDPQLPNLRNGLGASRARPWKRTIKRDLWRKMKISDCLYICLFYHCDVRLWFPIILWWNLRYGDLGGCNLRCFRSFFFYAYVVCFCSRL